MRISGVGMHPSGLVRSDVLWWQPTWFPHLSHFQNGRSARSCRCGYISPPSVSLGDTSLPQPQQKSRLSTLFMQRALSSFSDFIFPGFGNALQQRLRCLRRKGKLRPLYLAITRQYLHADFILFMFRDEPHFNPAVGKLHSPASYFRVIHVFRGYLVIVLSGNNLCGASHVLVSQ